MTEQRALSLLQTLDHDWQGFVKRQDLKKILHAVGRGRLSDSEIGCLLDSLDSDNSGFVSTASLKRLLGLTSRSLSLPKSVVAAGGIDAWNAQSEDLDTMSRMLSTMCRARTLSEALKEVRAIMSLGHSLWAYAYMRKLYNVNVNLYYAVLQAEPAFLLPAVYTPMVGEACQKFGNMPFYPRGCYVSITEQGRVKDVLQEYAENELTKGADGAYLCDCIVFSDAGRILGLGDLGAWGMGIPIGKLDLYTVCAGVNPYKTIPVIIDNGCSGPEGNTDRLNICDHPLYTGLKQARKTHKSAAGTVVNTAYYGEQNIISEFMEAACELFGRNCLLQFEDFNSNDAFPLLAEYREKYLTYNDDIQGTAAVSVAAIMGAIKLRDPKAAGLADLLAKETFLFHGSGSANIGTARLLVEEAGVPLSSVYCTNSRGLVWRSPDGARGSFRNDEQRAFARVGEPDFDSRDLVKVVERVKPSCVVGAVGVAPNCFSKEIIETLVRINAGRRPVVFALSNPKTQAEITASDAYQWSDGQAIYGSGTWFPSVELGGKTFSPGQVNNLYIFPGMSFGAISCQASRIPERFFLAAAEAVADSLDADDMEVDRVVPNRNRIADVSLNVATAVVLEAQAMGLAGRVLGGDRDAVKAALAKLRWTPQM